MTCQSCVSMMSALSWFSYSARVRVRPCSAVRHRCFSIILQCVACPVESLPLVTLILVPKLLYLKRRKSNVSNSPKPPGYGLVSFCFINIIWFIDPEKMSRHSQIEACGVRLVLLWLYVLSLSDSHTVHMWSYCKAKRHTRWNCIVI